jgi:hypothetical protein
MAIRLDSLDLNFGLFKVGLKFDDVKQTLQSLVDEMTALTSGISADTRSLLESIMAQKSGSLRVGDLCSGFRRGSAEHTALRQLRDAQFIRPIGGGRWKADSMIEIKPFGAIMWKKLGPKKLFS